jgi:hypothetical protein
MTTRDPIDKLLSGRMDRRAFHKRLASLGFVLTESRYRIAGDERVYDFLDAMMSPDAGAYVIDSLSYGHGNSKAFDLVSPERVAEVDLSDSEAFRARGVLKPIPPEHDQRYVDLWEDVRQDSVCRPAAILAGRVHRAPGNLL